MMANDDETDEPSPQNIQSPQKDQSQKKVQSPEKDQSQKKVQSPEKDQSQTKVQSPEKDQAPKKVHSPEKDKSPKKTLSPKKAPSTIGAGNRFILLIEASTSTSMAGPTNYENTPLDLNNKYLLHRNKAIAAKRKLMKFLEDQEE
jgi:hypothetical protein